jgi:hypothetical protein
MMIQHRATNRVRIIMGQSNHHKRVDGPTYLMVTVAILLECNPEKGRQPYLHRPLALCTKVESMVCLLDEWW